MSGDAATGELVLHHDWGSTCSQAVRLALAEKGLAFESRIVRLRRFEHLAPEFLALNPDAFVPVLVHQGFVVRESSVITAYLDAVFPLPSLLPADARGRAEVGMWTSFIDQVTSPAIKKPSFARHLVAHLQALGADEVDAQTIRMPSGAVRERWRQAARGGFTAEELADAHADLRRTLERIDRALARTPWLAGPEYTLADVHAMPFVERIAVLAPYRIDVDWPRVEAWRLRVRARPAFAKADFVDPGAPSALPA